MKSKFYMAVTIALSLFANFKSFSQANTTLSNLVSPTAVNQDLLPNSNNILNLGSVSKSWKTLYIDNNIYLKDSLFLNAKGTQNTFVGQRAGYDISTGSNNAAYGFHALYNNTTGGYNSAFGSSALANNTAAGNSAFGYRALYSNTAGTANIAMGRYALYQNTTGNNNVATGYQSLYSNTTGQYNTAAGYSSLYANTTGIFNIATGFEALYNNTTGSNNVANGAKALYTNTSGYSNIALGIKTLYFNKTGNQSIAIGDSALYNNTAGFNVAVGSKALYSNTTGAYNTALGYNADVANNSITNATAIGAKAVATQSNQVMLGGPSNMSVRMQNASSNPKYLEFVTTGANIDWRFEHSSSGRYLYLSYSSDDFGTFSDRAVFDTISQANGYCLYLYGKAQSYSWDVFSDARLKKNINDFSNATDIISKLKPKTFFFNKEKYPSLNLPSIKQYGLIAQELEQVLPELVTTSTVPVKTGNKGERKMEELKSVSYTSLIPVLIKGMQEQQSRIDAQQQQLEQQQQQNNDLVARIEKLEALLHSSNTFSNISSSYLEQNIPNPTKGITTIGYNLSEQFEKAQIFVRDINGKTLKQINVTGKGRGYVQINASTLTAGAYQYSLIVDGKLVDTKQMVLSR